MTASSLLTDAISHAHAAATAAERVDLDDRLAVIRSHAALRAELRRVLWTLDHDGLTEDDELDVAAQVDREDGVQRPVIVRYQRPAVAA
ncbi:hypothetical protein GCM10011583_18570 [Streptomyces camponoticapitis]|uniref:Uncharacterized protein n=1 Tax=Streptomyces camponoticapitis TaxID=1616125 RepID=A0ABQ2E1I4_9ACTN|nr:hypothetical protein [Streptomyces camponoticapitis]GGJ87308.1 hypothetical protein GCM10011583_18570 [Streptomyces camponoticapitis]